MDCSLPGFSFHRIFQARILEWVAISFFRRSSWPRGWTQVSHIVGTREVWCIQSNHAKCWAGWNTNWIKIVGRNINNLRYADHTTLMEESEEELKSLLRKVKQESEKVGLNLNIQKTKLMTTGTITSWQIDGETMEIVRALIFLGSKITADGDCSHESKTLTPWKKSYDQPRQHIKKQTHYFANKVLSCPSYSFSRSHLWMWALNYKETWVLNNWCF